MKFLFKWALNGIIVTLMLAWYADVTFLTAFAVASILTVIAFVAGDLAVLPRTNNAAATAADFLLAAVYLWAVKYYYGWNLSFGEIFIISLLVAWAEWLYHRYILGQKLDVAG